MLTLNSQREYGAAQSQLRDAVRVLIVGGGLIGCELAMDFCRAGKAVTVVDNAASVLAALMPPEVSSRLQHRLTGMGVHLMLKTQLEGLEHTADGIRVSLDRQRVITVDAVVAAAGLRPETSLARHAGLQINRGVVVNSQLQTSDPAIYALGDCAEINGTVMPFLQPILLSAMCLSKTRWRRRRTETAADAGEGEDPGSAAASGRRYPSRGSDVEHRGRQRGAGGERAGW